MPESFTCPRCGRTSYHPGDVVAGYCGHCHDWTRDQLQRTDQPHDRLTRVCAAMTDTFDAHPEHRQGDRCIVFLDDGHRGGLVLHGYDDDTEAMADLLIHLRAIFRANHKDLQFVTVPNDASGITDG